MAIPSGYSLLGRIGYNDRGVYTESSDYVRGDVVYHEGSSYVALATVTGVTPADDNTNWKYLARGFGTTELSEIDATDTSGFAGVVGKKVKGQTLIDKIAEYVMSKVVATDAFQTYLQKFLVDNCVTERSDLSLSAAQGKALMDLYTQLYSDKVTLQTGSYGSSSVPDSVKIEKAGVYLVYACGIAGSDSAYIHLYRNTVQIQGCQNTQGKSILAITVDNFAINDSVGFRWNNITESSGFRKSYGVVKL